MMQWLKWGSVVVVGLCCVGVSGTALGEETVVVYTALDRNFSEPIFEKFTKETGIEVLPKYDTESTKTVGLVNALIAEASNPRCDVFWNNEIVNTIRLKKKGLLQATSPDNAALYPDTFKDPDQMWYGFAARARVLIVNTSLVSEADTPEQVSDLGSSKFKGKTAIAKPLFGTTASHVACLFSLLGKEKAEELLLSFKRNEISVESGNKSCAVSVAKGKNAYGLTDTDDAVIEIQNGAPVKIVFPDQGADEIGVLLIPNTLALIKGCPHPEAGNKLINYLLSATIEEELSKGESAQIPLNSQYKGAHPLAPLPQKFMQVDFNAAADSFEDAAQWIQKVFLAQ